MSHTDEELIALALSYNRNPDGTFVRHDAYAEINRQVAAGRPWSKCPDCGNVYPMDREGADETTCSVRCRYSYAAYVMNPGDNR